MNQPKRKKSNQNILEQIENKIYKIAKTLILILFLFIWNAFSIIILTILGINYNSLSSNLKIITMLCSDILFCLFLIFLYKKEILENVKSYFNRDFKANLQLSFKYWSVGITIMLISNIIISIVTNGTLSTNEEEVRNLIDQTPWYMVFQLIIYAPITEEIIFRKSIKDIFHQKYLYILTSGIIFGGLHVLTSLTSPLGLLYLIPYCSLGFAFASLYYKTNNIMSTIIPHAFHNFLALILYLTAL